ncbi:MAG: ECF transporter S component [Clostridiales Family XIII bacterium]|jgi:uncharacterized membrane protein|nr:ECF transporter S component [Clostridiales Family XIII bacterium]
MQNNKEKTKKLVITAMFAALIFVITFLVRIPLPFAGSGYLNIGDVMIYLAAYILGGPLTAVAAALGSSLADLSSGYVAYMLPTFIIKGAMGLAAGTIHARSKTLPCYLIGNTVAGIIMVAGYFIFEYFFFSPGQAIAAAPFNMIQLVGCVAISVAVFPVAKQMEPRL